MKIYYDIQHHGDVDSLPLLTRLLSDSDNYIHISLDVDSKRFEHEKRFLIESCKQSDLLNVDKSLSLTWGGYSITRQMYIALKKALSYEDWDYFVNLSGACIPLLNQKLIKENLYKQKEKGFFDFCYSFTPVRAQSWVIGDCNYDQVQDLKYGRGIFRCPKSLYRSFECKDFNPARNIMHRMAMSYHEVEKGVFNVTPYSIDDVNERLKVLSSLPFRVGRQWVILSRDTVKWLVESCEVKKVLEVLKDTFISDESFFQMALYSDYNPRRKHLCNNSLRFGGGAPSRVDANNIGEVAVSGSLFARKVNVKEYELIVERLGII